MPEHDAIIDNPVTGERCRWLLRAADTGGALVRAEWWTRPGGGVRSEHVHAVSEERFEVLAGRLTYSLAGRIGHAGPGDTAVLPAGVPHAWWNEGDEWVHLIGEVAPAGHFEETIATSFGLAREGRVRPGGLPGLLQLAVMADAFGIETHPPSPPLPVLRAAVAALAPLGRLLGRRPTYARFA